MGLRQGQEAKDVEPLTKKHRAGDPLEYPPAEQRNGATLLYDSFVPDTWWLIEGLISLKELMALASTCTSIRVSLMTDDMWRRRAARDLGRPLRLMETPQSYPKPDISRIRDFFTLLEPMEGMEYYRKLMTIGELTATPASSFDIVHLGDHYWEIITEPSAKKFERVAHLNTVCWGEFSGNITHAPAGCYHLTWRVKYQSQQALDVEDPSFTVTINYGEVKYKEVVSLPFYGDRNRDGLVRDRWWLWDMGSIEIPYDGATLNIKYRGDNQYWWGDWWIEYVQLVPHHHLSLARPYLTPNTPHDNVIALDSISSDMDLVFRYDGDEFLCGERDVELRQLERKKLRSERRRQDHGEDTIYDPIQEDI